MAEKILVALGGNTMIQSGQRGSVEQQAANLRKSLAGVAELIGNGHHLVITHGNGPQVGHILIRAEAGREKAYDLPLHICVAQSQGEIGYLIGQCLRELMSRNGIAREVSPLLTCTVVDQNDPMMRSPTKPIGPFYTDEEALRLRERGVDIVEDAHRGYRRIVPSPAPVRIIEADIIRRLFNNGVIVIAAGGGGIPVSVEQDGSMAGVDAVVDKDFASSLLARAIGVEKILDLTAVANVKLNFGSAEEKDILHMTAAEAKKYLSEGHFAPGSMAPKIEAAIQFLEGGGREVIITLPEKVLDAFQGKAGTHIYPA